MSPNVLAMIKAFNQLALLVPTEILAENAPKARAKVIESFIKVSEITQSKSKQITYILVNTPFH